MIDIVAALLRASPWVWPGLVTALAIANAIGVPPEEWTRRPRGPTLAGWLGAVLELSDWDLAMALRGLLPEERQAEFDEMLALYSSAPRNVSACGAFASLSAAFSRAVDVGDATTVAAVLREVDGLMAECEGRLDEPACDALHEAVVTCFLENVLPVPTDRFVIVAPHIGPATRRWAERYQAWWLEPEPAT